MTKEKTFLNECFLITPEVFKDERGVFFENFNQKSFDELMGHKINFVQDNQSVSQKGVLRGLHFQTGKYAQAKLLRVINGKVLDVCVDLRIDSQTFGQHFSIILDGKENKQLFIPRGFAHGFLVLENGTIFNYKCDNYYSKNHESGIIFNDETLNIDWSLPNEELVLSEKDKQLPTFKSLLG